MAAAGAVEPDRPISVDIGEGPAEVRGDPNRLRQVIDNLREHTPSGTPASVTVAATKGAVKLVVTDEGPGHEPRRGLPRLRPLLAGGR